MRGTAMLMKRSRNSYIRAPRSVTAQPIACPSRRLKFAIAFLARVTTGRWPVIPRLVKIVVNVGMGDAPKNPKGLEAAVAELAAITGQRPVVTRAKKAIANFNLREGQAIGCAVTLRGARMYEFLDRFISIAVPRMRDFRGLPTKSFDGRGNYTVGLKEQMIFPEIDYDKVEKIHGMDITLVTSAGRDDTALALLRELGMPFRGEAPVAVG